jgi:ribonucleotide monophosphatase NagD (HAD superfamily)
VHPRAQPGPGAGTARLLLEQVDTLVLDLDGTVYLGDGALPGAARAVAALREAGKRTVFCSNNPTKTPDDDATKLTGLGIPTEPAEVFTSLTATVCWVVTEMPGAAVFPIGEQPLHDALVAAGVEAPAADRPHVVLERLDELLTAPALDDRAPAGRAPDRAEDGRP